MTTPWHERWEEDRIGFHKSEVHSDLDDYRAQFLDGARRILVPLCGKSLDLDHLSREGYQVVGVELVEKAVRQAFSEFGRDPEIEDVGPLRKFHCGRLTIYCGDIFDATPERIGTFDRVWDRAALVALEADVRPRYTSHLRTLVEPGGLLLQNVLEYDQSVMSGPPWSVSEAEVREHYGDLSIEVLRQRDVIDHVRWKDLGHQWWKTCTYLVCFP